MRLYHFTKLTYGLSSIRDKQLKIARFDELNDPFDILSISVDTSAGRSAQRNLREQLAKRGGMLCMSTSWNETLMWAHYADAYKGVCLAFDVDEMQWMEVLYEEKKRTVADYNVESMYDLTEHQLADSSRRKHTSWQYENEWRRFFVFDKPDWVTGLHFTPFNDEKMKFVGAIFGTRSCVTSDQVARILTEHPTVKVGFVRPGHTSYKVILDQRKNAKEIRTENRVRYDPDKTGQLQF